MRASEYIDVGTLEDFIAESNRIEGIRREPTDDEIRAHVRLLDEPRIDMNDVVRFVAVIAPHARLRDRPGLNVRVGGHVPPPGGPDIREGLAALLDRMNSVHPPPGSPRTETPHALHVAYETLHPFTDGNGRSGRALWLWQMQRAGYDGSLGFLHLFYYQTLDASDERRR